MKVLIVLTLCLALSQAETHPDRAGRIVGGSEILIAAAPYQAAVLYEGTPLQFICGGTLDKTANLFKVRVGSNQHAKGGNLHDIASLIKHPEYNHVIPGDYDVALMKVYTPIVLVANSKEVIKLVSSGSIIPGTEVYISGWGQPNSSALTLPAKLRGVNVLTKTQLDCTWAYCGLQQITDQMVCAGNPGINGCYADRGGPMVRESDGLLIGIQSYVFCVIPDTPAIYTRVGLVRDWIKRKTGV